MAIKEDRFPRAVLKAEHVPTGKERATQAIQIRRDVIGELNDRISNWNHRHCPNCDADLQGCGPQIMTVEELLYFGDARTLVDGHGFEDSRSFRSEEKDSSPEPSPIRRGSSEMMFPISL